MEKLFYYCPNSSCPHIMTGAKGPDCSAGMHVLEMDGLQAPPKCPYCGTTMTASCMRCGRRLEARPLRFCPSCGDPLLSTAAKPSKCVICGRPIHGQNCGQLDVPLCSERCISAFIQQNVRVCDNCGRKFNIADADVPKQVGGNTSEDEKMHEFCSHACMEAFYEHEVS